MRLEISGVSLEVGYEVAPPGRVLIKEVYCQDDITPMLRTSILAELNDQIAERLWERQTGVDQ